MPRPPPFEVLYEDNHLLVVNKPVGLATQGVAEGTPSVVARVRQRLA
jgi:23S rRNA-/tRNA-specific pseudouridylate synthase